MTAIVVSQLVLLKAIKSDKITYRLYTLLYNLQLAAACVSLKNRVTCLIITYCQEEFNVTKYRDLSSESIGSSQAI